MERYLNLYFQGHRLQELRVPAYGTIFEFVQRTNSTLSIMKNGEHWFHTDEQMNFLDEWIIKSSK